MAASAGLVDALGGVDITVTQRLPEGAVHQNSDGSAERRQGVDREGAKQHMDGDTAMWYARIPATPRAIGTA